MAETVSDDVRAQFDDYAAMLHAPESEAMCWARSQSTVLAHLMIRPIEGRFLQWLAQLIGARRIVEIGTCFGYSGLWLAGALPDDGILWTLEKETARADVAREAFERAGLSERVAVMTGDAMFWLAQLEQVVDMVFIDADKGGYDAYLDWALAHTRPGGLIVTHNAMRDGRVIDPDTPEGRVMDAFNRRFAAEDRLNRLIVPIGDGFNVGFVAGKV